MAITTVELSFVPGIRWAKLNELRGSDEQMVEGSDTGVAIRLLDRLLVDDHDHTFKPGNAATLAAADRDCLLAAIYRHTYGSHIAGTVTCRACGKSFDLDFDLLELQAALQPTETPAPVQDNGHIAFALVDGRRFRLPTGEDEISVWHLSADAALAELLRRCVLEGDPSIDQSSIQATMKAVAPLMDADLDGHCPECGENQAIHFDIQRFLLSALQAEQPRLNREIHRLASAYGWRLSEILALTRSQRQAHVKLIEAEATRRLGQ
jgi:hypothetical protein